MRAFIRKWWRHARALWERAKTERASPRQIGWAVAVGVFSGCTPAVGFHGWVAVGLATLLRLNRLWCWIGSRVSNMFILPFIVFAEIQAGTFVRTGHLLPLTARDALAQGGALFLDWCIGTLPVGAALGAILGLVAYGVTFRRAKKRALAAKAPEANSPSLPGA